MRIEHLDDLLGGFRFRNTECRMGKRDNVHGQLDIEPTRHITEPYDDIAAVQADKAVGDLATKTLVKPRPLFPRTGFRSYVTRRSPKRPVPRQPGESPESRNEEILPLFLFALGDTAFFRPTAYPPRGSPRQSFGLGFPSEHHRNPS